MGKLETIYKNQDRIYQEMLARYRDVLVNDCKIQYQVYIWDDGEIETLEGPYGDNSILKPKQGEPRELYHVCTVDAPGLNVADYVEPNDPDDEQSIIEAQEDAIEELCDEYKDTAQSILTEVIKEEQR